MDKINILNLRLAAKHGVYDFEKKKEGVFELDIFLYLDLRGAILSDNIKESVDYSKVVELVKKIFSENDCNLIEYVAGRICESIIEKYPVQKVVIKIRKPHAPIDADLDTVEVEIERKRK